MGKESLCKGKAEFGRLVDLSSYRYRFDSYSIQKIPKALAFGIFLSKPQAWHIIAAQSAAYIIKGGEPPLYIITRQRA